MQVFYKFLLFLFHMGNTGLSHNDVPDVPFVEQFVLAKYFSVVSLS